MLLPHKLLIIPRKLPTTRILLELDSTILEFAKLHLQQRTRWKGRGMRTQPVGAVRKVEGPSALETVWPMEVRYDWFFQFHSLFFRTTLHGKKKWESG